MAKAKHSTINLDKTAGADIPGTLRLNALDRHALHTALYTHAFGKEDTARNATEAALAQRVYDLTYTPEERAWIATAPEGALPTSREVNVYLDGQQRCLRFIQSANEKGYITYDTRPVFYSEHNWDRKRTLMISAVQGNGSTGAKLRLAQDLEAHFQVVNGRNEALRKASDQLTQTLKAFSSWRNLVAEWPEAEAIVRKVMLQRGYEPTRKVTTLPMVQLSEMNKLLDLPPEAEA